jgi:site-specific DNA recombinase
VNRIEGHRCQQVILYTHVSTRGQARSGYSLAQQLEVLRKYATRKGYEALEVVTDLAESGMSLERPGIDRVRDLVAAGDVSVVLAQDRDRLAREPEHFHLLRHEFQEKGCRLEFLNDLGVTDEQPPRYEWMKIAEWTRRGKLRKAREGKIAGGTKPNYGFRYNEGRDGYEVDEDSMRVIRRIFHMVGVERWALNAVKRSLEAEKVPTPSGNRRWATWVIRGFILHDVYRPHTFGEVAKLVTPEVAARLDPDKRYGIWWFNRERWTSRQVAEISDHGRIYRRKIKAVPKPKEEWVAVPVADSGVPREVVDAAQEAVLKNSWNSTSGDRFWELTGGVLHCGGCGRRMRTCVTRKAGRHYLYYACAKRREGREACPNRKSYRAESLESAVWRIVRDLLADADRVRGGFDALIRQARNGERGDPSVEARAWLKRLAEKPTARAAATKR